jgi:hypothetical protein
MTNKEKHLARSIRPERIIVGIPAKNHGLHEHSNRIGQFVRPKYMPRGNFKRLRLTGRPIHSFNEPISDPLVRQVPYSPLCKPEKRPLKVLIAISDCGKEADEKRKSLQLRRIFKVDTACFGMGKKKPTSITIHIIRTAVWNPFEPFMDLG